MLIYVNLRACPYRFDKFLHFLTRANLHGNMDADMVSMVSNRRNHVTVHDTDGRKPRNC